MEWVGDNRIYIKRSTKSVLFFCLFINYTRYQERLEEFMVIPSNEMILIIQ